MPKKHVYALIILVSFIIGIIHSITFQITINKEYFLYAAIVINDILNFQSLNPSIYVLYFFKEYYEAIEPVLRVFFSWFLVGIWLSFTIKFLDLLRFHREFHSPHNTFFFISGSLTVGIFYNYWGNFTGLLGENLLKGSIFYLSPWVILFAFPYFLSGSILLYYCYNKYYVVHVGQRSYNSRKFGISCSIIILFVEIFQLLFFYTFINFQEIPLKPIHPYPNIMVLFLTFYSFILMVRYGGSRRTPEIAIEAPIKPATLPEAILRRRPTRTTTPSTPKPTVKPQIIQPRVVKPSASISRRTTSSVSKPSSTLPAKEKKKPMDRKFEKLYPKAGVIDLENFKCIFCFQLPELPKDQGRGIILCPNCRHPAHADAFMDWLKSSNMCSRCGAVIPASFRNNPKIITIKSYLKVIYAFRKSKK